jgi:acetolactate synthase-1/2/3 large subunit
VANGAERLIRTARALGIELCFANPGTTEMPLVNALDRVGGIRAVPGLHENVCTGAADGYGRLAGRPALTLLHLGPGFANGIANLHNARRAGTPVVNLIGEHASWHVAADPPLAMDIERAAATVSAWQRRIASPDDAAPAMAAAIAAARSGRGAVTTLVFPHDHQLGAAAADQPPLETPRPFPPLDERRVAEAAARLRRPGPHALFLGGAALHGAGLALAGRLVRATGAALIAEVGFARLEAGRGLPPVARLPYFPEMAQAALDRFANVIVCGTKPPVSFFGYAGLPSRYLDGRAGVTLLAGPDEDAVQALEALAATLGAAASWQGETEPAPIPLPAGPLDAEKICTVLAALQPEDAVIVLTAVSSAAPYSPLAARARPHTQLALTGGAIGEGPALAIGAAFARPGRKIVNLEADGSGAYICQALWTQARHGLDIVTIVCANGRYRILELEQERAGIAPGPIAAALTDLGRPSLDWASLARGFGVPGVRAETAEELAAALARAVAEPGPALIEAVF